MKIVSTSQKHVEWQSVCKNKTASPEGFDFAGFTKVFLKPRANPFLYVFIVT